MLNAVEEIVDSKPFLQHNGVVARKGRAEDAQSFNLLAKSYGHLAVEAARARGAVQEGLFREGD